MPPSTTATVTGSPVNTGTCGQKSNACTERVFHCAAYRGSVGTHASVRRGALPMRTGFEDDGR